MRRCASRLKSCQIASNYTAVDAYSRGKIFSACVSTRPRATRPSPARKSANRNFLPSTNRLPFPHREPSQHLPLSSFATSAASSSPQSCPPLLTYFPWECKFRVTDIDANRAIYRTNDVEGKWMWICARGKIEAAPRSYTASEFSRIPSGIIR